MNYNSSTINKLLKPYKGLPKEIYIIFIARIVNALGMFVFPLLTLLLTKKLGLSTTEAGVWITLSGLVFMPAGLIGGKLADSYGRKKLIIVFDTLAALCYIICAIIPPSMTMVYLIVTAGFFMGVGDPAHSSIIADLTTPENRDGAFSLTYLGFNIGFAVGPIIGGLLFENHLRLFFLVDAITALMAITLIYLFVEETLHKTKEEVTEDRAMEQIVHGSIFSVLIKRPMLLLFSVVAIGYNFVYAQWGYLIPLHVESNFANEGARLYGLMASANGAVVMIFTAILTAIFIKKSNIRKMVYGGVLYVIGFGMLGFVSTKVAFFVSVFIFTLGEILVTISFMPFIANHTPASHRGRMNSILPLLMGLGYTLAPVLTGKALEYISIPAAWKIIGAIMITSTLLMALLDKIDAKKSTVNRA